MVKIRPAVIEDLDGIMEVERETFEPVGEGAMASQDLMLSRIKICNTTNPAWFYVAECDGRVVGDMILQPTNLEPEDCKSWDQATDKGTLVGTFSSSGKNIYGVSLAASPRLSPSGTTDLLIHKLLILWLATGKNRFFICSRMPGYRKSKEETGVSPEDYWQLKSSDSKPTDWMLRLFSEMIGVKPVRLLKDGFSSDVDSCGYGVLCVDDAPLETLDKIASRLYEAGVEFGLKQKEGR